MQPENSQENQLRQYALVKQQIGDLLHAGFQYFGDIKNEQMTEQFRSLLAKLAEDRFNLAVVGQFKRGKSSLMNAVIGRDLLPTGLLPLTSVITSLCYGPEDRVILKRKDWVMQHEISIADLADYVTEQSNPGNEKGIMEARVEISVPFLRRGLFFIDTPGIGSSRTENTATTYTFLPEADAVIFVTSVEAPISEPEKIFLQDIRQHAHKLFVVVNKIDLLSQNELDQVLDYICEGIGLLLGESNVRIYPLSAQQALEGKLHKDNQSVQQSGIIEFEAALTSFLSQEKTRIFLISILDRALGLLNDYENGSSIPLAPEPQNGTHPIERIRSSIESLWEVIQSHDELIPRQLEEVVESTIIQAPLEQAIEATQIESKTGQKRGFVITRICPICAAQSQAVWDFFVDWQYEISKDEDVRRAFRGSHGFCGVHTWLFQQIANAHGINQGYAPLIEVVAEVLHTLVGQSAHKGATVIDALIPTVESCPACRVLRQTGEAQIPGLLAEIATPEGQERYHQTLGVCLPHLRLALLSSPPQEIADFLLSEAANRLEEISEDMHSYVLKHDALRRGLLNSNEENAWRRALLQLAGERTAHAS